MITIVDNFRNFPCTTVLFPKLVFWNDDGSGISVLFYKRSNVGKRLLALYHVSGISLLLVYLGKSSYLRVLCLGDIFSSSALGPRVSWMLDNRFCRMGQLLHRQNVRVESEYQSFCPLSKTDMSVPGP